VGNAITGYAEANLKFGGDSESRTEVGQGGDVKLPIVMGSRDEKKRGKKSWGIFSEGGEKKRSSAYVNLRGERNGPSGGEWSEQFTDD